MGTDADRRQLVAWLTVAATGILRLGETRAGDRPRQVGMILANGGGGLVVAPTAINNASRERIVSIAVRLRLPAVYPFQHFADAGGLLNGRGLSSLDRASPTA